MSPVRATIDDTLIDRLASEYANRLASDLPAANRRRATLLGRFLARSGLDALAVSRQGNIAA